jgi:hypothetical protein
MVIKTWFYTGEEGYTHVRVQTLKSVRGVCVCVYVCVYLHIIASGDYGLFTRVTCVFRSVCAHIIITADINISCTRLFYSRRDARASARSLNAEFYSNSHIFITILSFLIASRSAFGSENRWHGKRARAIYYRWIK